MVPAAAIDELVDLTAPEFWIGRDAPSIETRTLSGDPWSLADQEGRVVLLDFWATWCKPCIEEMPKLRRIHERHGDRDDFVMAGVALDESAPPLRRYLEENALPWTQLFEPGRGFAHPAAEAFDVHAIPQAWLIGRDGRVVGLDLRGDELAAAVEAALSEGEAQAASSGGGP